MVRAPCCDKIGLKKGPWTPKEDQILISYVQKYGHVNWRALPKQAGLLRCGKSCRLRWINYLRPDIKRGNFTSEEEETIIKLHEMLGNRWSAIAAKLPGRTDNEIKNVWHTHLKKRLKQYQTKLDTKENPKSESKIKCESSDNISTSKSESGNSSSSTGNIISSRTEIPGQTPNPLSPQPSSSEISSITTVKEVNNMDINIQNMENSWEDFPEIDESFWSDALSSDNSSDQVPLNFKGLHSQQVPSSNYSVDHQVMEPDYRYSENIDDAVEFWYDMFIKAGGEQEFITNSNDNSFMRNANEYPQITC